jgi:hypothetical protein
VDWVNGRGYAAGAGKEKFNFPEKMPIYQASPMTPPHPAWVFSETWANLFGRSHE